MRIICGFAALALLVVPLSAGVQVDHEPDIDFKSFHTYTWKPGGTEAARPEIQAAIVRAIERELNARGLRKVVNRRADLYIVTQAYAELDSQVRANYMHSQRYDVGVITQYMIMTTRGVLVVDLLDGDSERPLWRGMASEVMSDPDIKKILKKVDKVTRKMFKDFPPD